MALLKVNGSFDPLKPVLRLMRDFGFRALTVEAPGQDAKVKAAIKRGDKIPVDGVKEAVREALEEEWGEDMDAYSMADAAADAIEDEVASAIREGRVEGPKRKTKPSGTKLLDTGDLADSITARIER